MRRLYVTALALLGAAPHALAQAPVIASGGVENAASNVTLTSIAPQVLIAIKGQNLATSTAASGYPLPTQLGGATVSFSTSSGTVLAPLFYASSTQMNAQVPNGIAGTSIVVTTAAGSSAPYNIPLVSGSIPEPIGQLGIFTDDGTGCGQAVAFNIPSDGSPLTPNSPQNSLDPKKDLGLAIYLTGLGGNEFTDRQNSVPWVYNGSDNPVPQLASSGTSLTSVTFGAPGLTASASNLSLTYLGPAPDKVAIGQANVLGQWKGWPQGCRVPLSIALLAPQISYGAAQSPVTLAPFTSSQLVDVSIQPGGGSCADPANSTLGILTWQTNTVSDVGGVTSSESVTAQFIQSDGLSFAQPGPLDGAYPLPLPIYNTQSGVVYGFYTPPPPACNASLPSTLDAGALMVSGPGIGAVALQPSTSSGRLTYQATLPAGTLHGGTYQVTGQGGSQVGDFTATADISAPIQVTSNLAPGTQLEQPCEGVSYISIGSFPPYCAGSYSFSWTGGDARSIVSVQLSVGNNFRAVASAYGSTGEVFIPESYGPYPDWCQDSPFDPLSCVLIPAGNIEVIVTQTPFHEPSQAFSAPGLGWGGESTWKYVWDFRGLTN